MMRSATTTLAVAAVLLAAGAGRAADFKIAVVDMQRALNDSAAGKRAKEKVRIQFEKAQGELKRQKDDLDKQQEELEKKSLVLRQDQSRDLQKSLESKSLDFKRKYEDFQRDLKRTDAELTSGIVEQLYGIVAEYGQQKGYTMVLETSSGVLLYSDKSVDITDEIIKLHDANPDRARAKRPEGAGE